MKRAIFFVSFVSVFVIPAMPDYPQENSNSHPASRAFFSSLVRRRQESAIPQVSWKTRIVGGIEAQPNQFPYQVSVHVRNYFGGYDHLCGGVIYDAIHIVTAAHCLSGYHHRNLKVIAGEHDLFKDEGPEQYRDVASTVYHPGFIREIQLNDIGIITLDHPLDLNAQIQPLRLPNEPIDYSEIARTTGWGEQQLVRNDEQQSKLMYVDLTYFPRENCSRLYDGWAFIEDGMLCYGESDGVKEPVTAIPEVL
ncbi:Kallikrein 1-related peptidase b3 [Orchesella cincta]|uniref:Kallikrein 1-related peptidase b3 n=1 Tax=Orchesella cincta TaxID=48709 RepID=A0A1D2MDD2_ORCCI|nr:Kallikrein 1-related peptidase b3 [Orchesella cincta]